MPLPRADLHSISDIEFDREDVRRDGLKAFTRLAWHLVEPSTPLIWGWHIDVICEHLEALLTCEIHDLVINMPPRHMKSLTVSVFFPAWVWTKAPHERMLFSSYAEKLSIRDSIKTRRIIESPWYRERWGHVFQILSDQNQKIKFENDKSGYRLATSVDGSNTGEGGDIIVVDDAHNVQERESVAAREGVIDWWDNVMSTRTNDPKRRRRLIMGQRVHERDIAQVVIEKGGWTHLSLPAEYEGGECPIKTCTQHWMGDPRTELHALLWPDRYGREELDKLKADLGTMGTAAQLQQRPAPLEGNLVKKAWFRYYEKTVTHGEVYLLLKQPNGVVPIRFKDLTIFLTVDLASSLKTSADYTVVSVWGLVSKTADLLWLDCVADRLEGPDQTALIKKMYQTYAPDLIGIESNNYQLTMIQNLLREGLPCTKLKADVDKVSRFLPMGTLYENGKVYHPLLAEWVDHAEAQLLQFPNAAHDDHVDTASYAARLLTYITGAGTIPVTGH